MQPKFSNPTNSLDIVEFSFLVMSPFRNIPVWCRFSDSTPAMNPGSYRFFVLVIFAFATVSFYGSTSRRSIVPYIPKILTLLSCRFWSARFPSFHIPLSVAILVQIRILRYLPTCHSCFAVSPFELFFSTELYCTVHTVRIFDDFVTDIKERIISRDARRDKRKRRGCEGVSRNKIGWSGR